MRSRALKAAVAQRAAALRRAIHVSLALSLVYYLVPEPVPWVGLSKPLGVFLLVAVVTAAEAWRLKRGWRFFLFRDYEMHRPAAYYWLGLGCALAVVFFPARFATLTILGVCFADPAIGIVSGGTAKRFAMAAGFAVWVAAAVAACIVLALPVPAGLIVFGAAVAVVVEPLRLPYLDDDFTMNIVPLVAITLIARVLPG